MTVTVQLSVTPPPVEDIGSLAVYESANPTGPFSLVQTIIDIGVYPDWLTLYDVTDAISIDDWFAIQWADIDGAWITPLSPPFRAGQDSLVILVVDRVLQRDRAIDRNTAQQEAEAAIEYVFNKNPYGVDLSIDVPENNMYRFLNGLTYLVMARSYLVLAATQESVESATIGMVSFKTATGGVKDIDIQSLLDRANIDLGIQTSLVLQMEDVVEQHPEWIQWWVDWQALPWITGIPHGTIGS